MSVYTGYRWDVAERYSNTKLLEFSSKIKRRENTIVEVECQGFIWFNGKVYLPRFSTF